MVLTVLEPTVKPSVIVGKPPTRDGRKGESEVDSVDLTRSRSLRPLASGRSALAEPGRSSWGVPAAALIEPSARGRWRGWFLRTGAEAAKLDPADGSGLAWSAVGLKVAHPNRPHRLTLKVKEGEPAALGVALIEPGDERRDRQPRVLLDACAAGPPILEDGPPLVFSWLVWPGSTESVLVLVNRDTESAVRLGTVTLTELDDVPPPPAVREPEKPPARTLGLYLTGTQALDPFRDDAGAGGALASARNLAKYLGYCGATAVVVPDDLSDRRGGGRSTARPTRIRPVPISWTSFAACSSAKDALSGSRCLSTVRTPCRGCRRRIRRMRSVAASCVSTVRGTPMDRPIIPFTPRSARP